MKAKEGETMSLEAIKQITAAEQAAKERRAAVEAEARRLTAEAEKAGLDLLQKTRADAEAQGKAGLAAAEERAAARAAEIAQAAEQESARQRKQVEARMDAAAELIVERVVKR